MLRAALDLADNWPNLIREELRVYTDNAAGIALYETFGLEMEGPHRRFAFRKGRYADAYSMAREGLRSDIGAYVSSVRSNRKTRGVSGLIRSDRRRGGSGFLSVAGPLPFRYPRGI